MDKPQICRGILVAGLAVLTLLLLVDCSGGGSAGPASDPDVISQAADLDTIDYSGELLPMFPYTMSIVQMTPGGTEAPLGTVNLGGGNLQLMPDPSTIGLGAAFFAGRSYRDFRVADFNGDGIPDLVTNVYNFSDAACGAAASMALLFFQNPGAQGTGDGTFTEQPAFRNLRIAQLGETIVTADFANNGSLDLFVPQYAFADSSVCTGETRSYLLQNDGSGNFSDIAKTAGVSLPPGSWSGGACDVASITNDVCFRPEGAQALDLNDDGWIDLYVASHLFLNNGDMTFTDARAAYGLPTIRDEGVKFLDWNNDGKLDLLVNEPLMGPILFQFDGTKFVQIPRVLADGTPFFSDGGKPVTLNGTGDSFGMNVYDINNDGLEDILVMGGSECNNMLFLNTGRNFVRVHPTSTNGYTLDHLGAGQGAMAFGDLDNDGLVDLAYPLGGSAVCAPFSSDQMIMFTNHTAVSNSSFVVEVVGPNGERNQQGRVIRATPQSHPTIIYTRVVDGGSGFLSQNEYPITVGTPYSESHNVTVRFANITLTFSVMPGQWAKAFAPSATYPSGHVVIQDRKTVQGAALAVMVAHRAKR
jgi:hypothetical protein